MKHKINKVLSIIEGNITVFSTRNQFNIIVAWECKCHCVVFHSTPVSDSQPLKLSIFHIFTEVLGCRMFLYAERFGGDYLEFCQSIEDCIIESSHIKDTHLMTHAKSPEQRRNWKINLAIVNDGLGNNSSTQSVYFIDLLDIFWNQ